MEGSELNLIDLDEELVSERKIKKYVIKGGKKKKVGRATGRNQKLVGGNLKTMSAAERIKRSRAGKKTARKLRSKQHSIVRKRNKSMKKRKRMRLSDIGMSG
jgi:hypothetical protein